MMNGHKEFFYVDAIDASSGKITCNQANFDRSFVREKGIILETESATRYWKDGQPAKFGDIKVGDRLRTKTHGIGKGKVRMCWEVFLDEASLLKFQAEQRAVHARRLAAEGAPGYVDVVAAQQIELTLFQEAGDIGRALKAGAAVRLVGAGPDRQAAGPETLATIKSAKFQGNLCKVSLELSSATTPLQPRQVLRLWVK